jgi:plasmid rolling circle replication initiator protein Rep
MHFYNTTESLGNQGNKPFKDLTKTGKVRPWKERKTANVSYAELLQILEYKKAGNVGVCGRILEFKPTDEGYLKLFKAWFCKSKLCPICNWRRSMKNSVQTQRVVESVIKDKPKARWLFLTLTTKNVADGEMLKDGLSEMTKAFNKLFKYKKVNKNLIGFMRNIEVTVNPDTEAYNQHMHILLCVENSYFKNKDNYIAQKEWTELWKKALKINYDPVVDVRAIKPNRKGDSDIQAAVKETSKYSVKSSDFLTDNQKRNLEIVADLEEGLYRKRMISYGGLLKEKHKELNLDDAEDGDLINTSDEEKVTESEEEANSIIAIWNYQKQNYYLREGN